MESENSTVRAEKFSNSNYYYWKFRIQHLLILKDLEKFLYCDPPSSDTSTAAQIALWREKDMKGQAIIGFSLSNGLLENNREVISTKDMWTSVKNVFERHTLLNKLLARRKFYTAAKSSD